MHRTKAQSIKAAIANSLVEELQLYFVDKLEEIANEFHSKEKQFEAIEWFRDQGLHGGGIRYVANNDKVFNRASVNVSQIHYDDDKDRKLASATALSTIIHPDNPFAPSVHMHISWTEMKNDKGYWRMMADLNPAIENKSATTLFNDCLKQSTDKLYALAAAQGERYFFIPTLGRHRGVSHFYLEEYNSGDEQADIALAKKLTKSVIDCYIDIIRLAIQNNSCPQASDYKKQRAYHTLYLFQVLTLDRGTTSGLLVHKQNDLGIMGSLPAKIDKKLLVSWKDKLAAPQDKLLIAIIEAIPDGEACIIEESTKLSLANAVRQHYQSNPNALAAQAQGNSIPPTVDNHQST